MAKIGYLSSSLASLALLLVGLAWQPLPCAMSEGERAGPESTPRTWLTRLDEGVAQATARKAPMAVLFH